MRPELIDLLMQQELLRFYGWWQLAVCLFAFVGLMGIWWHIGRKQNDDGQVWLALSVLCWSISGLVEVVYVEKLVKAYSLLPITEITDSVVGPIGGALKTNLTGWRSILSLFNSLFILLSLPWFRYVPEPIAGLVKSRFWYLIVGLPFLFSLLPTLSSLIGGRQTSFISELDVYYALFTLVFLGYVLWSSFARRRLPILAGLSVVCILITIVAQLYKFTDNSLDLTLYSAIFKTALIMLFFALALSWVKELSEMIVPDANRLRLKLRTEKAANGRLLRIVRLSGLTGKETTDIPLSTGNFELLQKFMVARQADPEAGWLEIKPKFDNRSGKTYDINDHNQIKRLVNSLLDGLYGKNNWSKELHHLPLKEALFESSRERERLVRLRMSRS